MTYEVTKFIQQWLKIFLLTGIVSLTSMTDGTEENKGCVGLPGITNFNKKTDITKKWPERAELPRQDESETAYVRSFLASLAEPAGAADFSGIPGDSLDVIVWLQELPAVLGEKYGMERALSEAPYLLDGANARQTILTEMSANIRYEYTEVFTGFAMTVSRAEIQMLAEMPGVYAVLPDNPVHTTEAPETQSIR